MAFAFCIYKHWNLFMSNWTCNWDPRGPHPVHSEHGWGSGWYRWGSGRFAWGALCNPGGGQARAEIIKCEWPDALAGVRVGARSVRMGSPDFTHCCKIWYAGGFAMLQRIRWTNYCLELRFYICKTIRVAMALTTWEYNALSLPFNVQF